MLASLLTAISTLKVYVVWDCVWCVNVYFLSLLKLMKYVNKQGCFIN